MSSRSADGGPVEAVDGGADRNLHIEIRPVGPALLLPAAVGAIACAAMRMVLETVK